MNAKPKILITGCTGFLGLSLTEYYVNYHLDTYDIVGTGRNRNKIPENILKKITFIKADIVNKNVGKLLCKNIAVVIHCAALCKPWGAYKEHFDVNFLGTANIVDGCMHHGVKLLIHISSPSVLFPVNRPSEELNVKGFIKKVNHQTKVVHESEVANNYIKTKLLAEKLISAINNDNDNSKDDVLPSVLSSSSVNISHIIDNTKDCKLRTIILRPRAIFGPGDTTLLPRLLKALKANRFPIIDAGKTIMDLTYIDNLVHAINCSVDIGMKEINNIINVVNVENGNEKHSIFGNVYNVTNDEPVEINWLINKLCKSIPTLSQPTKKYSRTFLWYVANIMEFFFSIFLFFGIDLEPPITKYTVNVFSCSVVFDISQTKKDLNYEPIVNMNDAIDRTIKTLKV